MGHVVKIEDKGVPSFGTKTQRKDTAWKIRHTWEGVNWIYLAQARD